MGRPKFRERARYWFDQWMSRGTGAIMLLLAATTAVFVLALGTLTWVVLTLAPDNKAPEPGDNPWDFVWGALMRTLDPGTMGGDQGWSFRILMLLVTIGGLVIVASLIGIVSGAFDRKTENLRKGRSRVLETGHTLILGWSSKIFVIIGELAIANESRGRAAIVVLADRDKVEMDDEIRERLPNLGRTRVICRTGDLKRPADLALVGASRARSIVLLGPDDSASPDNDVIKAAFAITSATDCGNDRSHVVAELRDPAKLPAARTAGHGEVSWVLGADLIGRIAVQCCRQPGLSLIYRELLDFAGDEIYVTSQRSLVGKTYFEAQLAFEDSAAIGLVSGGRVALNPAPGTLIGEDDEVIVIAQDDSTIRLGPAPTPDATSVVTPEPGPPVPECTLLLGANDSTPALLRELDQYVAPGSTAHVISAGDADHRELGPFEALTVTTERADATDLSTLERLDVARFDHILVVPEGDERDPERADSRTLVTLLELRDLAERCRLRLNIVSEVLDDANRELAEVAGADDFIVSDKLIALAMAQTSENRLLAAVFADLLDAAGNEVYLRPAHEYVAPGATVDFYTVLEAARRRGQTAIGYRVGRLAWDAAQAHGVRLNPRKSEPIAFEADDRIVVLAEG